MGDAGTHLEREREREREREQKGGRRLNKRKDEGVVSSYGAVPPMF